MKLNVDFQDAKEAIKVFRMQIDEMNGQLVELGKHKERIGLINENLKILGKSAENLDVIRSTQGLSPKTIRSTEFVNAWHQTRRSPAEKFYDAVKEAFPATPSSLFRAGNEIIKGGLHFISPRQEKLRDYFQTSNRKFKDLKIKELVNLDFNEDPTQSDFDSINSDIFDMDGLTGKVDDFQKTTTDALKTVKGDLDLVNLNGWSLMRKNISDTSIKFDTEFKTSSDSALSTVSTGLTAVNTGYGAVNTAATSLFNQTGTGFGNSLVAAQNYQENGLNMLGLTLGNQLPASLGIFQTSHETSFGQMQGVTSAAYTKMGLAAHDFFDDVGFQASQVLGGLVTGEINSLDEAWSLFRLFPRHHLFDVIHRCH